MNIEKEKLKLQKSADKIRSDKMLFIERVQAAKAESMKKVLADAGADDLGVPVNDRLEIDDLISIERTYNEPRAHVLERIRTLENAEKKMRSDEIPALIEKLDAAISDLKAKLTAKESERAGLTAEKRDIDNNLQYRGGERGAITYKRVSHLLMDERVNPSAKASHYSYIVNF